jgi:small-conductance mechanosensitive channel
MNALERAFVALGIEPTFAWRVLGTAAVIVAWLVVLRLVRRLFARTVDDLQTRFSLGRIASYVLGSTSLLVIARIWIQGVAGVSTYLGLLSAGLAIALQDLITNLAGWLFVILRRPFKIGDRIQIGGHAGDIVDIRPFRFMMLEIGEWVEADQSTGRVIHIPNGWVFKHAVANYDEAFAYIWNELQVTVTFESDWRAAKGALEQIVGENSEAIEPEIRRRMTETAHTIHHQLPTLKPTVWTTAADSGVMLTVRYLCKPRERRSSASAIWEKVLDAFAALPNVDLAYPTTRFFDNTAEGKSSSARLG